MPTVFVVQDDGTKDLAPVLRISERVEVIANRPYPLFGETALLRKRMRAIANRFKDGDYLLLIGDPINIGLAFHYIMETGSNIKLLKWDKHTSDYLTITLTTG